MTRQPIQNIEPVCIECGQAKLEKLFARGEPELNTGCLLWPGATNGSYGRVFHEGKTEYVHRLSYRLSGGTGGPNVLHRCDTPLCFWPAHLFGGTQLENIRDSDAKGRMNRRGPRGERASRSKLKAHDIPKIRADPRFNVEIAKDYGVSDNMIGLIKRGKSWTHIP